MQKASNGTHALKSRFKPPPVNATVQLAAQHKELSSLHHDKARKPKICLLHAQQLCGAATSRWEGPTGSQT